MKASTIMGAIGVALLGGLIVASMDNAESDQRDREIREACMVVGAVDAACPGLFPDVEVCQAEDCSDIRGNVGFWRDPADPRQTWLIARPGMAAASQKADQP